VDLRQLLADFLVVGFVAEVEGFGVVCQVLHCADFVGATCGNQ
jgi:hypothetical protein